MLDYHEHLLDTPTCVIAFGSGDRETVIPGLPNYEFANSLRALGVSYVLMRDGSHTWYEGGIRGIGNKEEVVDYIRRLKDKYRVITTGSSFGAYGALLYGQLAGVEVIAISPLTVIGPQAEKEFAQHWHFRIQSADDLDLKPYFTDGASAKIKAFITDGDGAELDSYMVARLGIADITLIPGHTHGGLARHMRDAGLFKGLFT